MAPVQEMALYATLAIYTLVELMFFEHWIGAGLVLVVLCLILPSGREES